MTPRTPSPHDGQAARLDTASLRHRARAAIRASIVAGKVEAGTIYPVVHFAEWLGVSATPIREALFDLAGAGLVEVVRNRGFRVPLLSEEDLDDLFAIRMMLERPAVVTVAAVHGLQDSTHLRRLAREVERHAASGDVIAFLAADRDFHYQLLAAHSNRRLIDMIMELRDHTRLHGLQLLAHSGRLLESARIHTELLTAVETQDIAAADTLIVRHLRHTRGVWAGRGEGDESALLRVEPEGPTRSDHPGSDPPGKRRSAGPGVGPARRSAPAGPPRSLRMTPPGNGAPAAGPRSGDQAAVGPFPLRSTEGFPRNAE